MIVKLTLSDFPYYDSNLERRQRKTHLAVENALLELLQEKPINSISISELSEKADINRKTFYNNYTSIDDVVEEINQHIFTHIFNFLPEKITIRNEIEIYHLLLDYTTAIEPHKKLLKQIFSMDDNLTIVQKFRETILPYIKKNLLSYRVDPAVIPYINSYIVNGLTSIFHEWFLDDSLTAGQVALLGYNLTISAIKLDNYKDIMSETQK